jgi:agmatinase
MQKPYQGLATFLKSPFADYKKEMGFFGIPFDGASSFRPGSRMAPNAIRQMSMMLTDGDHPEFETNPCESMTDFGDIYTGVDVNSSLNTIATVVAEHEFTGLKPLFFAGGDHTIVIGILRGFAANGIKPRVVHFDSHCDTWQDNFGEPIGHGTWVRNAIDEHLVPDGGVMSIGPRSPVDPVTRDWLVNKGGITVTTREALSMNIVGLSTMIRNFIGDSPWYLSFDIDVLDPAFAPGTGTPEIGGLSPHFMTELLSMLPRNFGENFMGMDMVEVNPTYDPSGITSLAGATFLWLAASMYMIGK